MSKGDCFIQVTSLGIRHIGRDVSSTNTGDPSFLHSSTITDWADPNQKQITHAVMNSNQIVISLINGGLLYILLNELGLPEPVNYKEVMCRGATALAIPSCIDSTYFSPFVAAISSSRTLNMFKISSHSTLPIELIPEQGSIDAQDDITSLHFLYHNESYSVILGLSSGIIHRVAVDSIKGCLSDLQTFQYGKNPCIFSPVSSAGYFLNNNFSINLINDISTVQLCTYQDGNFTIIPIANSKINQFIQFSDCGISNDLTRHVIGLTGATLVTIELKLATQPFAVNTIPLSHIGRCCKVVALSTGVFAVTAGHINKPVGLNTETNALFSSSDNAGPVIELIPLSTPNVSMWTDQHQYATKKSVLLELPQRMIHSLMVDETILSMDVGHFNQYGQEPLLVVGTGKNVQQSPFYHEGGAIFVFRFNIIHFFSQIKYSQSIEYTQFKSPLELIGRPTLFSDKVALSLHVFKGHLLAGFDKKDEGIALYALGSQQLMIKARLASFDSPIKTLTSYENTIAVGDSQSGVFFISCYPDKDVTERLSLKADEATHRHVLHILFVDSVTCAVSDKFGTISFLRFTEKHHRTKKKIFNIKFPYSGISHINDYSREDLLEEMNGTMALNIPKIVTVSSIFVGSIVTSLSLVKKYNTESSDISSIIYSTINGSIGVLTPMLNTSEYIELYYLQEAMQRKYSLFGIGSSHNIYRNRFSAPSNIIDFDLIQLILKLPISEQDLIQKRVSENLLKINKDYNEIENNDLLFIENPVKMIQTITKRIKSLYKYN